MQLLPFTTNVVSSNPTHVEMYSIQHYVVTFVGDFQQVYGCLRVPPPTKSDHDIDEIFLKVT